MNHPLLQSLLQESCVVIDRNITALDSDAVKQLCEAIGNWEIDDDNDSIKRVFKFQNYYETMAFVNSVAWIAHQQDHHPDLTVSYHQCKVTYSTHVVGGLSRNDFICAARINQLFE